MRRIAAFLLGLVVGLAGCGDDEDSGGSKARPAETAPADTQRAPDRNERDSAARRRGTQISLRDSEYGPMLFDSRRQAIYIFQRDSRGKTVCYGECARAWPPVLTDGEPRAREGVRQSLLGTVRRRDGKRQVTYAGRPLYFYDHEGPGEVRCHNVNLNGGLWWVVGADGKRRP